MAERRTAAAAACLLLAGCLLWAGRKHTAVYQPDETAFPNAQIGYAPGVLDTVFGPLVKDYASDGYGDACQAWADYAEKACAGLSPERAARCREIFKACSEFELGFWRMANQPRSDL